MTIYGVHAFNLGLKTVMAWSQQSCKCLEIHDLNLNNRTKTIEQYILIVHQYNQFFTGGFRVIPQQAPPLTNIFNTNE